MLLLFVYATPDKLYRKSHHHVWVCRMNVYEESCGPGESHVMECFCVLVPPSKLVFKTTLLESSCKLTRIKNFFFLNPDHRFWLQFCISGFYSQTCARWGIWHVPVCACACVCTCIGACTCMHVPSFCAYVCICMHL